MKISKQKQEIYVGIGTMLFSIVYFILSLNINVGQTALRHGANSINADLFPLIISGVSFLASGAILWSAIKNRNKTADSKPRQHDDIQAIEATTTDLKTDMKTNQQDTEVEIDGYTAIEEAVEYEEDQAIFLNRDRIVVLLLTCLYLVSMPYIGYLLSSVLFSFIVLQYLDKKHWVRNIIFSAAFTLVIYIVFDRLFQIYLPVGQFIEAIF